MKGKPNVILILVDDMGYSDIGCYGGEIDTPNLDYLARNGVRFTQFYNTAKCSPSRASLLTGLHPHQVGMGILANPKNMDRDMPPGYRGDLSLNSVTIAEVLKDAGYRTYLSGKWHLSNDVFNPNENWPLARGFDHHYGNLNGSTSYFYPGSMHRDGINIDDEAKDDPDFYYTDAISDHACKYLQDHFQNHHDDPFFLYIAYTAPHWPLHAREKNIAKYEGVFDDGWDVLREKRLQKLWDMGILKKEWALSERYILSPPWEEIEEEDKEWFLRRMEVYAAQIDCMDQGVGRIIQNLEDSGTLDNTVILFLSDNGASREEMSIEPVKKDRVRRGGSRKSTRNGKPVTRGNIVNLMPGGEDTFQSYGVSWANLSNTPFRLFKNWTHEGGIATPLIIHWPEGIKPKGELRHHRAQLTDIMATIVDITGVEYPSMYKERRIPPMEGKSLVPAIQNQITPEKEFLFFEYQGNAAMREGKWKIVKQYPGNWELYDMDADRSELHDLSEKFPERVSKMNADFEEWAKRCGVLPRGEVQKYRRKKGKM